MQRDILFSITILLFLTSCNRPGPSGCFPEDRLPGNVEPVTSFGQRAKWSPNIVKENGM
ncbi:MAG: hypothetical protein ACOCUP_02260 [bacterium]